MSCLRNRNEKNETPEGLCKNCHKFRVETAKKKKKIQNKSLHPKIFCKKKKRMIKEIREDYKKP